MPKNKPARSDTFEFFIHLARAFGGSILFSFPLLMTMEMWWLGFYMDGFRLTLFTLLTIPLLVGLAYYDGFEPTSRLTDDVVDTFVAYAVGFVTSTASLLAFGIINLEMSAGEIIGKISLQAIICSFGAMFAQSLLKGSDDESDESEKRKRDASYFGELFLMAVGAVFLSMSVAPTEEMELISYRMTDWHTLALAVITLLKYRKFHRGLRNVFSKRFFGEKYSCSISRLFRFYACRSRSNTNSDTRRRDDSR
jgi:putative integral membrane protein (TIGR02587 family)